jgi:hypothetical protein
MMLFDIVYLLQLFAGPALGGEFEKAKTVAQQQD